MTIDTTIPPGLAAKGQLSEYQAGGVQDWLKYDAVKYYTNAFILQDGKMLLGYKKRGFGKDLYNGFGGKVEPGETAVQAAVRELQEEAGITAPLERAGTLFFVLDGVGPAFHIEVFFANEYSGTIIETDEMRPQWFSTSETTSSAELPTIPYKQMWQDDIYWMPHLLAGKSFIGRADFSADEKFIKWWFAVESTP